jgi:signal transduction histidine kinase
LYGATSHEIGSGLGLAIVKSFAEIQDGEFRIEIDGDLFKVTTIWQLGGKAEAAKP